METVSEQAIAQRRTKSLNPVLIIGCLFFVFGFITWMNGTLIPFLKLACNLKIDAEAFLVTFSFYMAYFFLAIPSSALLKMTGMKNGMSWGLVVMAIGALIFIPAAKDRSFGLFLTGFVSPFSYGNCRRSSDSAVVWLFEGDDQFSIGIPVVDVTLLPIYFILCCGRS